MLRFPLPPFLPALLAACLFFCGCAAPASDPGGSAPGSSAIPALAEPSATPASGNPVWLFYQDFYSAAQAPLDGLHNALAQSSQAEALDGELLLSALEDRLTEGMVSFGLLMGAEEGSDNYASAVGGAANGAGSITREGSECKLSFLYADGAILSGALTPYRLQYSRQGQSASYSLLLLRAPQGWAAVLDLGSGPAYVLRSAAQDIGLYAIAYSAPAESPAPTPAPRLITYENCIEGALYSWVYAGGALIIEG